MTNAQINAFAKSRGISKDEARKRLKAKEAAARKPADWKSVKVSQPKDTTDESVRHLLSAGLTPEQIVIVSGRSMFHNGVNRIVLGMPDGYKGGDFGPVLDHMLVKHPELLEVAPMESAGLSQRETAALAMVSDVFIGQQLDPQSVQTAAAAIHWVKEKHTNIKEITFIGIGPRQAAIAIEMIDGK